MAIPEAGCGEERRGSHGSVRRWLCGWRGSGFSLQSLRLVVGVGEAGFSWHFQTLVVDGRGGSSHGSSRRWLWGGELVVLISVSEAGCGGGEAEVVWFRDRGSHGSPRSWFWGERRQLSWKSQTWLWGKIGVGSHGSPRR